MDFKTSIARLSKMDKELGKHVYSLADLRMLFPEDNQRTLNDTCRRLIEGGALERAANGVFVFTYATSLNTDLLERIANTIRRGEYNYLSLESVLSSHGVISQITQGYITMMTTGREGLFTTSYGTIEFTHTARSAAEIVERTIWSKERPFRTAPVEMAYEDLKRVNRNLHLVSLDELEEVTHAKP
ncbi:hypothetical protein [Sulfitobacter sp. R18_1]|uniref:type IV toxin-antitoxin system AbiEi family antitoxin n=1 Tax=Sulfitobacter sp. R18_1 TaxID=2821104 RepID=UPI001ADCABCA|nr:hypothetical protein [Sulfitobacter sp. R18_1]MBO9428702.1 hypothetical protein [Sulfitobacter sp. R18_1]